jgi:hypothetical protein
MPGQLIRDLIFFVLAVGIILAAVELVPILFDWMGLNSGM